MVHVWCMYGAFWRFCMVQIVCCAGYTQFFPLENSEFVFYSAQLGHKSTLNLFLHTNCIKLHEETRKIMKQILRVLHDSKSTRDWKWWSSTQNMDTKLIELMYIYDTNLDVSIVRFASYPSVVLSFTPFSHLSKPIIIFY